MLHWFDYFMLLLLLLFVVVVISQCFVFFNCVYMRYFIAE